jgi:conjugal transfer/entry exclusion protein
VFVAVEQFTAVSKAKQKIVATHFRMNIESTEKRSSENAKSRQRGQRFLGDGFSD